MTVPCVLVLAGLDPSGGAGLLADAEAVRAAGARPLCVATALTVQTTQRARGFSVVEPAVVLSQARALLEEEPVAALKLGMLGSEPMADALAALVAEAGLEAILDPVLRASSGAALFAGPAGALWPLIRACSLVTPNLAEAQALVGSLGGNKDLPRDVDAMERAARALVDGGARAVLVKGGHLDGDAVDVLWDGSRLTVLRGPRLPGSARGTGCRLASAIAARLALGDPLHEAARAAKEQVRTYLCATSR